MPRPKDWEHVKLILPFLQIFHRPIERISRSSYVTSIIYMLEVLGIGKSILNMCNLEDENIIRTTIVLDSRCKMKLVVWMTTRIYDNGDAKYLKIKLDSHLKSIFEEYSGRAMSRLGSSIYLSSAFNAVNDMYHCAEC